MRIAGRSMHGNKIMLVNMNLIGMPKTSTIPTAVVKKNRISSGLSMRSKRPVLIESLMIAASYVIRDMSFAVGCLP